jgi:hypothetical protein
MRQLQLDLLKLRPEKFASAQEFVPKRFHNESPSIDCVYKSTPSNYTLFRLTTIRDAHDSLILISCVLREIT